VVSVVGGGGAPTATVQLRRPDGTWVTVASPLRGDGRPPTLLDVRLAAPVLADAVRVEGVPAAALTHLVVLRGR
jgi:hypothetical protein